MAQLSRLSLQGIRSFGPEKEDAQVIKFFTPVTLILGQNGCGKTTIIEALKCATTGEFPSGSNSGQGFVHDPKLSSRDICYGQIKLEIVDAKSEKHVIIKCMQVTQKKDKMQFKSIDSTITKGGGQGVSSRCIDATENACLVMGVSKPILNNVIFCHQEDSLWPLEESKKLKEKFDAIFDAVKYNKTCDQFRKIIKEREANLKVLKEKLNSLKEKQVVVKNKQKLLRDNESKKEKCDNDIDAINSEIKPIVERIKEIRQKEDSIAELEKSLVVQEYEQRSLTEQINAFIKNLDNEEFIGSDAELQKEILNTKTEQETAEQNIEELQQKQTKYEEQQQLISNQIATKQVTVGGLQADKQRNEADVKLRFTTIQEAAASLKLPTFTSLKSEGDIDAALNLLKRELNNLKDEMQAFKSDFEKEDADLQDQVDKCRDKTVATKSDIDSKNKLIEGYQKSSFQAQSQLRELGSANTELEQLKRKIIQIDNNMEEIKSSYDNTLTEKIEKNNRKIQEKDQELVALEQEYKVLQSNAIADNELQNLRQLNMDCKIKLTNLNEKHSNNFSVIFPKEIPRTNLKLEVEEFIYDENQKLKRLESNKLNLERQATAMDTKLSYEQNNLKKLQQELTATSSKIESVTNNRNFTEVLEETTLELEEAEKDKGSYAYSQYVFEKYITELRKSNPCCPICERDFKKEPSMVARIIQSMHRKISNIPTLLQQKQESVADLKAKYKKLLQLQPLQEKVEKLQTDIPNSKETMLNFETQLKNTKNELKTIVNSMKEPQQKIVIANLILNDAALIEKYQADITTSKSKIEDLESQLIPTASNRSVEQVSMLIEDLKEDMNSLKREVDSFKQKVDRYKNQCQELRDKRNNFREKQLGLEKNLQNVVQLENLQEENRIKEDSLRSDIKKLQKQLKQFQEDQDKALAQKSEAKIRNNETLHNMQVKCDRNQRLVDEVQKTHIKVQEFIVSNKKEMLSQCLDQLQDLTTRLKKFDDMKTALIKLKSDFENKMARGEQLLRNLNDNISLRSKRKELEAAKEAITHLKRSIGSQNKTQLTTERLQLTEEYSKLIDNCNRLKGSSTELVNIIKEIKKELEMPMYRDVESRFKEQYCTNRITERVIIELKQYLCGLEFAIMQFHKHRMVQINDRLRFLWRSIYKGNDIDYIEIMTEETIMGMGKRRTFNYKVMQLKQNVKLEMRGRCSAGQKVLACLLIRIALAETFSTNCGVLALDEPTTNLDKENIRSLSKALAEIISRRQNEKNFQLIIITHDEEFLDNLRTLTGNVPYYWQVSRNASGLSVISKQFSE